MGASGDLTYGLKRKRHVASTRFGSNVYIQWGQIPSGTIGEHRVADLPAL
jgi:hypothetical protein